VTNREQDPIALFLAWRREAGMASVPGGLPLRARRVLRRVATWIYGGELPEENSAALATATPDGRPSARMVLVKVVTVQGFDFHTSYVSRKGRELDANPRAALVFHWPWPPRQVRVEGSVGRLDAVESDAYWRSRPRGSQLAAVASTQSAAVADRSALLATLEQARREHEGREVPRPTTWGGYRLVPDAIEFWEGRPDRLHERVRFHRQAPVAPWRSEWLQP